MMKPISINPDLYYFCNAFNSHFHIHLGAGVIVVACAGRAAAVGIKLAGVPQTKPMQ